MTSSRQSITWREKQTELIREEIEALLAPLSDVTSLCDLIKEPLLEAGPVMDAGFTRHQLWLFLPLLVCEAICGRTEPAVPVAVTFRLLKTAAEVFDDIEDADSSNSLSAKYGVALATNVATTLVILAEKAIAGLKARGVADSVIVRIMDSINSSYTTACAGQHLDIALSSETAISEDIYLKITGMKTASQIECACNVGALVATTNQELIDSFTVFGNNLGMASQIVNDIQGVTAGGDILKRRISLPVIYALTQSEGDIHNQLTLTFYRPSEFEPDPAEIRNLLFRTGAIHYATIKMELYKQQALNILSEVQGLGAKVERLKLFLE
jgi:octaprenyl-diphosphate synthase